MYYIPASCNSFIKSFSHKTQHMLEKCKKRKQKCTTHVTATQVKKANITSNPRNPSMPFPVTISYLPSRRNNHSFDLFILVAFFLYSLPPVPASEILWFTFAWSLFCCGFGLVEIYINGTVQLSILLGSVLFTQKSCL